MAGTTLCLFGALRTVSLANVTTLLFVAPLLVVALSGPVLGERIRNAQWLAVGGGFVGVALVFRPAIDEFDWGMPLALGAAVCGALHQLVSRELSRTDGPLVGLFYVTLVGTAALGTLALFDWRTPSIEDWAVMAAMGLIAAAGYFAVFKAIELASPARLAPFYYLQIITAVALGYGMFGDIPDAWTVLGLTVIVGAGLVCLGLERVRRRAPVARGLTSCGPRRYSLRASGPGALGCAPAIPLNGARSVRRDPRQRTDGLDEIGFHRVQLAVDEEQLPRPGRARRVVEPFLPPFAGCARPIDRRGAAPTRKIEHLVVGHPDADRRVAPRQPR